MDDIRAPVVRKEGVLVKMGGGEGGHKNWKDRYFVLSDHLYYYDSVEAYKSKPDDYNGRIVLNCYYCSKTEDKDHFGFTVNAYPKSLDVRAKSAADREEWIATIMAPLADLAKVPGK